MLCCPHMSAVATSYLSHCVSFLLLFLCESACERLGLCAVVMCSGLERSCPLAGFWYHVMFLYCVSPCFILQNVIRHYHTFLCDIFKLIFLYLLLPVSCCIQDRPHFLSCYFNYIFEAPSSLSGNHYHSHAVWIFIQFLYFICHFSIHAFTLRLTALT